jgi:hypothetical protein
MKERPMREISVILQMLLAVAIPVALTLMTVKVPLREMIPGGNPTPWGYTVSLLIFLVPVLFVARGHIRDGKAYDKRAFYSSAAVMAGIGTVLDIMLGYHFFQFPNREATLGLRIPAWDWSNMTFVRSYLPVEEFGFYILGAIFMASIYLWAGQHWLSEYERKDYDDAAKAHQGMIHLRLRPSVVVVWLVGLAIGLVYRFSNDGGVAGYFLFVWIGGLLPTVVLSRTMKKFVNWHAMAFAFIALVLVSIIWEATLGVPYEWWTYREDEMLGIFITGWANLPLEAVMVWCIGVWDAVLIYEFFRVFHRKEEDTVMHRLFGIPQEKSS